MSPFSLLFLTVTIGLSNFFVLGGKNEGCIDSFAELEFYESRASSLAHVRHYILCENTNFDAGSLHPFYGTVISSSSMLHLRPNLHIQCGASGRRENNCHFRYGDIHVDGTSFYGVPSSTGPLENVVIEGVTFMDSRKHVAFIDKPGDVEFRDCVFQNNTQALLPVKLDYFDSGSNEELSVRFRGCTFTQNQYSGTPANPAVIVGTSSQNAISIIDCDFTDNDMTTHGGSVESALIESTGSLKILRTCFVDNLVSISPAMTYRSALDARENFQQRSKGSVCPLATSFVASRASESPDPTCTSFDSPTCMSLDPHDPTPAPTLAPTARPSLRPSDVPSGIPTESPVEAPSALPSNNPSPSPSTSPATLPSSTPSTYPSDLPSTTITSAEEFSIESSSWCNAPRMSLFLLLCFSTLMSL